MSILGKILAAPIRLINLPARLMEDFVDPDTPEHERMLSAPLDRIADGLEKGVDYVTRGKKK